jgi:hypothetical protein
MTIDADRQAIADLVRRESNAQTVNGSMLHGVEVDMVQYCRFFSRAVRTADGWRLKSFDGIHHKDTITPVNPADTVPIDWDAPRDLRPSYAAAERWLAGHG